MGHRKKTILVWAAAVFFGLVAIQTAWPVLPQIGRLRGVVDKPTLVDWDWASIASGETSKQVESWFTQHIGFRPFWVSLDNQVSYTFFGETRGRNEKDGTQIVVGPHDWLFEHHYIDNALRPGTIDPAKLKAGVAHLKSVQAKLAKRGIPLVLIVAPSKAEVYPEHIPASLSAGRSPEQFETNFEKARAILKAEGVSYYDGPAHFAAWKAAGQRNLFARSGTHWSYIAALQVLQDLRQELNPRMKHQIPELVLSGTPLDRPRGNDADLIELANLLVPGPYEHDLPFPELVHQTAVPAAELPRILWVHDSFGWILHDLMYAANAEQPTEALYYFRTAVGMPDKKLLDLDAATGKWIPSTGRETIDENNPRLKAALARVDWNRLIKPYDAVVVVWTEIAVDFFSWGLLEQLDRALD